MTTLYFHRTTAADLPILMTLMREFHDFDHTQPFDEQPAKAAMEKIVMDDTLGRVWLVQQSQQTVGYMVLTLGYRLEYRGYYAFLDELYICEDHRGQGIGTRAMQFLLDTCQSLKVKQLQLEVKQDNSQAAGLYVRAGLTPQSRTVFTQAIS